MYKNCVHTGIYIHIVCIMIKIWYSRWDTSPTIWYWMGFSPGFEGWNMLKPWYPHEISSLYGGFLKMVVPNSWMVYKGKSHYNGWFWGTPIYGNHHIPIISPFWWWKNWIPFRGRSEDPRISGKADVFNIGTSSISGYFYGMQST